MRCPILKELPPPPIGKAGWPWTEETPQLPAALPDGSPWPRISIVTPAYNQGQFLEETLRSVLLQGYPNLEYLVMDGGSTDGSLEIIRKYEPWLTHWESEPDRGQSHAINKGWQRASGDIFGWLNSDDVYEKGCLEVVGRFFAAHPEGQVLAGGGGFLSQDSQRFRVTKRKSEFDYRDFLYRWRALHQPSCFWRTGLANETGGYLDETLHFALDWELMLRFWFSGKKFYFEPEQILSFERWHPGQKSRLFKKAQAEFAEVGSSFFDQYLGGRRLNFLKMVYYLRSNAVRRGGWRNLISSFPSRQEKAYWRALFKKQSFFKND